MNINTIYNYYRTFQVSGRECIIQHMICKLVSIYSTKKYSTNTF